MTIRNRILAVAASFVVLTNLAAPLFADPIPLTQTTPDITAGFIDILYTPGAPNGHFTATGYPLLYNAPPASSTNITGATPSFSIDVFLDPLGHAVSGTLTITGEINPSIPETTLLTGDSPQFGFTQPFNVNDEFQFIFKTTGGALQSAYGSTIGVLLHGMSGPAFPGFADPYANDFMAGTADVFPVPTPLAWSAGSALFAAVVIRKRFGRRQSEV